MGEAEALADRHKELLDFVQAPAIEYWRDDDTDIEDNDDEMGHPCAADSIAREREETFGDAEQCTYDSALARKKLVGATLSVTFRRLTSFSVRQEVDGLDHIAWKLYRKSIQEALISYLAKNEFVRKISPMTVIAKAGAEKGQSSVYAGQWQALMIERKLQPSH